MQFFALPFAFKRQWTYAFVYSLVTCLTLLGTTLGSSSAYAQSACSQIFLKTATPVYKSLPSLLDQPLPPEVVERIKTHWFFKSTRHLENKPMEFSVDWITPKGEIVDVSTGEAIQGMLAFRFLKVLFPQAQRVGRGLAPEISPIDYGEIYSKSKSSLDLVLLKAANPSGSGIDRQALRRKFNIPQKAHVVSIYIRARGAIPTVAIQKIVSDLHAQWGVDTVFINAGINTVIPSAHVEASPVDITYMPALKNTEAKAFSELTSSSNLQNAVIVNDVRGYLPYAHALSDIALVIGPINFMEPLTVGTPTVVLNNAKINQGYDTKTFSELAERAEGSGGAHVVNRTKDVLPAMLDLLRTSPEITPPYIVEKNGNNAIDNVVDNLAQWLSRQGALNP